MAQVSLVLGVNPASAARAHLNLNRWRREEWTPAVRAACLEHRPPYALRHSFAAWSIAAGIGLFELARIMGTSVEQIDRTYGRLLPDSIDRARDALERVWARYGHRSRWERRSSVRRKPPSMRGLCVNRGAEI